MSKETMYDSIIKQEATNVGLPFEFVKAIIKKESVFDKNCKYGDAHGLMQVQLSSAQEVGYTGTLAQLYEPKNNIKYGARYLAKHVGFWEGAPTMNDKISLGAASYNLGKARILRVQETARKEGIHPLKWQSIEKNLPLIVGRGLTRRRINVTINYVNLVNGYMQEFMPIHDKTVEESELVWKQKV